MLRWTRKVFEMQRRAVVRRRLIGMHSPTTALCNAQLAKTPMETTTTNKHCNMAQAGSAVRRIQAVLTSLLLPLQLLPVLFLKHQSHLILGRKALHEVLITITLVNN